MLSSSDALAAVSSSAAKLRNQEYLGIHNVLRGIGYWAFFSDLKIGDKTTSFIPIANLYKYNITDIINSITVYERDNCPLSVIPAEAGI